MEDKVLLVGNGINRANKEISWKELIRKLSEGFNINTDNKPLPLLYEEIEIKSGRASKNIVADTMQQLQPTGLHKKILDMKFKDIITTNYDFALETAYAESDLIELYNAENDYNIFRRYQSKNSNVWHIHGEINKPDSIQLGYDDYVKAIIKMEKYLYGNKSNYNEFRKINDYDKIIEKQNYIRRNMYAPVYKNAKEKNEDIIIFKQDSWIDLFYTKDIYILGLSLDYVEYDLWWLLTQRAKGVPLIKEGKEIRADNKITFICTEEDYSASKRKCNENNSKICSLLNKETSSKFELMETMGLEIKRISHRIKNGDENWTNFYVQAFEFINHEYPIIL